MKNNEKRGTVKQTSLWFCAAGGILGLIGILCLTILHSQEPFYREIAGRYPGAKLNIPSDEMGNSYMDLCYHRGAWFLKELMDTMGEEDFLEAVSDYCNRYLYQNASTEDFLNVLACHGAADISGLLEEYLDVEMN